MPAQHCPDCGATADTEGEVICIGPGAVHRRACSRCNTEFDVAEQSACPEHPLEPSVLVEWKTGGHAPRAMVRAEEVGA